MIRTQFLKTLETPKNNDENCLESCQNLILFKLEQLFTIGHDLQQLNQIFENNHDYIGTRIHSLLKYLFKLINQNFINKQSYKKLQEQTQKLQLTIRNHIKMEHQMTMYLEFLQVKLQKNKTNLQHYNIERVQLKNKEVLLLQETENLKKKNQLLSLELQKVQKVGLLKQFQNDYQSQNVFQAQYLTKNFNNNSRQRQSSQHTDRDNIFTHNKINKSVIQNMHTECLNNNYEDNPVTMMKKKQKFKQLQNQSDMSKFNIKRYSNDVIQCEVLQKISHQTTQKKKFNNKLSYVLKTNY